jgi:uncharacterized protein YjbI with pentapeptide repeats
MVMQATIQLYFSTLALSDVEHMLTILLARGATHYGRPSWIATPVTEVKEIIPTAAYATSFSLRGKSALGAWTADFSITPQRALCISFDSPVDSSGAWSELQAMMQELLLLPLVDFCIAQGYDLAGEKESQDEYRLRVSGKLLPGVYARSGLVALGFDNYIGPRILKILPADARDALLAHPLAKVQGEGLRLSVASEIPNVAARDERAGLNALMQRHKLVREMQGSENKLAAMGPRWWRAPAAGLLLTKFDPALRKVLSALEGSQKSAVEDLEVAQQEFPFAAFAECKIEDCRFCDANASYAAMSSASFSDCDFVGAKLIGIEAQHAVLSDSSFVRADLSYADLSYADLKDSRFDEATLRGARLGDARGIESARSANFDEAQAAGLKVGRAAVFDDATFRGADLSGVDFSGASLMRVDFSRAKLEKTCFRGANLAHAVFAGANVSQADFADAILDGATY